MDRFKEWILSGILIIAITPLAFLLMPFLAIAGIVGAVVTWMKSLRRYA